MDARACGILFIWHVRHRVMRAIRNRHATKSCCGVWHVAHLASMRIRSSRSVRRAIYNWCATRILHPLLSWRIGIARASSWSNSSIVRRLILGLSWIVHYFLLRSRLRMILAAVVTWHLSIFLTRLWTVSTNWIKSWASFWSSIMDIFLMLMGIRISEWSSSLINILVIIWT